MTKSKKTAAETRPQDSDIKFIVFHGNNYDFNG